MQTNDTTEDFIPPLTITTPDLAYQNFLNTKRIAHQPVGFTKARDMQLSKHLFPWQADLVRWALRTGRADLWCDCGLGKSLMSLEWGRVVHEQTNKNVLLLTPLAVNQQFKREGKKFGIGVALARSAADIRPGINVTNYERLDKFDPDQFGAIICDEISILKSYDGSTRQQITDFALRLPYRLGASATPAPNDFMELGTQSEFIGSLSRAEMLATFFVHDGGETSKWRLKRHAEEEFWKWIATWAVYIRKPSDLGYSDDGFVLPPLNVHHCLIDSPPADGDLFTVEARTINERRKARRDAMDGRLGKAADLACSTKDAWVVWVGLNAESKNLADEIPDSVEVTGSMSIEAKEEALEAFSSGQARVIVTKGSMAGFGLNWQHCHKMTLFPDDSWERYYQQTRRCYRFGQKSAVDVYVIASEAEGSVVSNLQRKEKDANKMAERIAVHMKDLIATDVVRRGGVATETDRAEGPNWTALLGDAVETLRAFPDEHFGYSVFSPAFASLYTYSDSLADMGNCRTHAEFYRHFSFMVPELFRTLQSGRTLSFHCMNLPASKERDGFIGIWDFRGNMIRLFQTCQRCSKHIDDHFDEDRKVETCGNYHGFVLASEVCIWKDPVTAMQRTKAIGLLYKQLRKDSAMSRQGIPDYLVTMRKLGVNANPITKVAPNRKTFVDPLSSEVHEEPGQDIPPNEFAVSEWQEYASPVWMDIKPGDTLTKEGAREHSDERHICPLQLEVVRRAIRLWTNPGDVVLSPFMGIGSEGYVAIGMDRKFVGIELKRSYFDQAVANLKAASLVNLPLYSETDMIAL